MKALLGAAERVNLLSRYLAQAVIFFMMLLIVADALTRKLNMPIAGASEFTEEYLMVGVVFLALGPAHVSGKHIKIEIGERLIPRFARRWTRAASALITLVYFALVAYYGWQQTAYALQIDKRSTSELAYPLAPAYFLVVFGAALLCVWLLRDALSALAGRTQDEPAH